ncbi:hypothetical protein PL10110_260011 [Planktothrix agardhii]|nr:hypothetical protein PL10110_260011 [Planktothrix agardhii]
MQGEEKDHVSVSNQLISLASRERTRWAQSLGLIGSFQSINFPSE